MFVLNHIIDMWLNQRSEQTYCDWLVARQNPLSEFQCYTTGWSLYYRGSLMGRTVFLNGVAYKSLIGIANYNFYSIHSTGAHLSIPQEHIDFFDVLLPKVDFVEPYVRKDGLLTFAALHRKLKMLYLPRIKGVFVRAKSQRKFGALYIINSKFTTGISAYTGTLTKTWSVYERAVGVQFYDDKE